jgi:DNA-binding response OmpR family regulator
MARTTRILLIDDEPLVREELGGLLEDEGYDVIRASDGEEGLEIFRREAPDLVISDVRMPRRDGISVAMVIRHEAPHVPIAIITGHGSEQMVVDALRAGVTDFLAKPVRVEDLSAALGRMEAALRLARVPKRGLPQSVHLVESRWVYELENDTSAVPEFVDALINQLASQSELQVLTDLNLALSELITNAIEHGNLALSYEEKSHALEQGALAEIVAARSAEPRYVARRALVTARQKKEEIVIVIKDQGEGFDWRSVPDPLDPSNMLLEHGRGIFLARTAVDEIAYNNVGNEVTITKRLGGR